jgi:hypothetical protein
MIQQAGRLAFPKTTRATRLRHHYALLTLPSLHFNTQISSLQEFNQRDQSAIWFAEINRLNTFAFLHLIPLWR